MGLARPNMKYHELTVVTVIPSFNLRIQSLIGLTKKSKLKKLIKPINISIKGDDNNSYSQSRVLMSPSF